MLWLLFSCTTEQVSFENACTSANNGICEEQKGCPLGSDSNDCDLACEQTPWTPDIYGACAHDMATLDPDEDAEPGLGSEGTGGLVGTWDSIVTVRGASSSTQVDRYYRVYVPRRYNPDTPTPLIFVLGGFSVDMYWLAEFTEMNRMADREDFIVVYGHPQWRDFGSRDVFSWYAYNQAHTGGWEENPDIEYMETILGEVADLYNIDMRRVFVSGHSRGGALAIIAAFERPDLFAGLCPQAGFIRPNEYDGELQVLALETKPALYLVHGEDDPDVSVRESDTFSDILIGAGWSYNDDWYYQKIPNATHEWQSQYNQFMWDYLFDRPNPLIQP